jgi:hypothetical protein
MYLRSNRRKKDGKEHRYYTVVEKPPAKDRQSGAPPSTDTRASAATPASYHRFDLFRRSPSSLKCSGHLQYAVVEKKRLRRLVSAYLRKLA